MIFTIFQDGMDTQETSDADPGVPSIVPPPEAEDDPQGSSTEEASLARAEEPATEPEGEWPGGGRVRQLSIVSGIPVPGMSLSRRGTAATLNTPAGTVTFIGLDKGWTTCDA